MNSGKSISSVYLNRIQAAITANAASQMGIRRYVGFFERLHPCRKVLNRPEKTAAKAVLDSLPDDASWEDAQYHLYVRQQIDAGLEDEAAGRLIDTDEMRRRLAERGKANG